jgi:hypothetical protein
MTDDVPKSPSVAPASTPETLANVSTPPPTEAAVAVNKLTPEEQMALFEQELKETDWGHQPC